MLCMLGFCDKLELRMSKTKKTIIVITFIFYLITLIFLTFFRGYTKLDYLVKNNIGLLSIERIRYTCNFIPFKTIRRYIYRMSNGIRLWDSLINLLGNLVLCFPMGFYLPVLFPQEIKSFKVFVLFMSIIIIVIETLQFVTTVGTTDVDDFILNLLGAVIAYGIYKLIANKNSKTE